jgi:hypothetical protein
VQYERDDVVRERIEAEERPRDEKVKALRQGPELARVGAEVRGHRVMEPAFRALEKDEVVLDEEVAREGPVAEHDEKKEQTARDPGNDSRREAWGPRRARPGVGGCRTHRRIITHRPGVNTGGCPQTFSRARAPPCGSTTTGWARDFEFTASRRAKSPALFHCRWYPAGLT